MNLDTLTFRFFMPDDWFNEKIQGIEEFDFHDDPTVVKIADCIESQYSDAACDISSGHSGVFIDVHLKADTNPHFVQNISTAVYKIGHTVMQEHALNTQPTEKGYCCDDLRNKATGACEVEGREFDICPMDNDKCGMWKEERQ